MDAALLIGNGLNRCYDNNISWNNLLENIANKYDVEFNEKNSFLLEFESIINQILRTKSDPNDEIYETIKGIIAKKMIDERPDENSLHEVFVKELGIHHILTTNYDYMLERVCDPNYSSNKYPCKDREKKYSVKSYMEIEKHRFYHIHGEASYPATICLGYEHYVGQLAKMRKTMKKILKNVKEVSSFKQQPTEKEFQTWLNLFFTHDIYIVGFKLDLCEIDLWWLITYRAYLYYSNIYSCRNLIKNKIKIYITDSINSADNIALLNNLYVECEIVKVEGEQKYEASYKQIAKQIKNEMNKRE